MQENITYKIIDETSTQIPMVSVSMLAYNHQDFITEAIESVMMQQTNFEFVLVIAEDFSPDNTRKIIIDYQKRFPKRIKLILQNTNVGASKNSISIVENLNGKYIATCEGDDFWTDPLKLQKQVDFLESNTDFGLCCSNFIEVSKESLEIKKIGTSQNLQFNLKDVILNNPIGTLTVVYRNKEIISEIFSETSKELGDLLIGDLILWSAVLGSDVKGMRLNEYMAAYRVLQNSASGRDSREKFLKFENVARSIRLFFSKKYKLGLQETIEKQYFTNLFFSKYYQETIAFYEDTRKKYNFSLKEKMLYLSAKNKFLRSFLLCYLKLKS